MVITTLMPDSCRVNLCLTPSRRTRVNSIIPPSFGPVVNSVLILVRTLVVRVLNRVGAGPLSKGRGCIAILLGSETASRTGAAVFIILTCLLPILTMAEVVTSPGRGVRLVGIIKLVRPSLASKLRPLSRQGNVAFAKALPFVTRL